MTEDTLKFVQAIGLMTTAIPKMEIDIDNPIKMASMVVDRVQELEAENKRLKQELNRYKSALTRAVALPMGQLPHCEGYYYTVMLNGQVTVKESKG